MQNGIAGRLRSAVLRRGWQPTTLIERRGFGLLRIGPNWRDPRTRIAAHQVTARERNVRETSAERREPVRLAYLYALSSAIVRDRSARIGLFQSVGALALGGHPDSALTAQFIRPRALGMALAHPAETDPAVRVDHETSLTG